MFVGGAVVLLLLGVVTATWMVRSAFKAAPQTASTNEPPSGRSQRTQPEGPERPQAAAERVLPDETVGAREDKQAPGSEPDAKVPPEQPRPPEPAGDVPNQQKRSAPVEDQQQDQPSPQDGLAAEEKEAKPPDIPPKNEGSERLPPDAGPQSTDLAAGKVEVPKVPPSPPVVAELPRPG